MKLTQNIAYLRQAQNRDASIDAVFTDDAGEYIIERSAICRTPWDFRLVEYF